jgi:hypothetical protein
VGVTVVERRMGAVDVVIELRDLLERGAVPEATALAHTQLERAPATALPFAAVEASQLPPRSREPVGMRVPGLTPAQRTSICHRDGFVDRLSPERWRLVYPGALRVLSLELRGAIDTVVSKGTLRSYAGNAPVWWDLWPTVDHLVPRAGGGTNEPDNLACVSWWRNAAKGDLSLEATGWTLQPAGDARTWDGLLGWFVDRVRRHPELAQDGMVRQYLDAAATVTEVPLLPRPARPTRPQVTTAARRLDEPSPTVARAPDRDAPSEALPERPVGDRHRLEAPLIDRERRGHDEERAHARVAAGSDTGAMVTSLVELLAAVVAWFRAPRPEGRPWEQDLGGPYVFCTLCRDWHPPGNCGGEWP